MKIEERTEGDVTTLFLKGGMMVGEDDERLRERIATLVEAGRVNIVLDMANVPCHRLRLPGRDSPLPHNGEQKGRQTEACESKREASRLADKNQDCVGP